MKQNPEPSPQTPLLALEGCLETGPLSINPLGGDGSDRSYFRIRSKKEKSGWVLMQLNGEDRQLLQNNRYEWVHLAKFLQRQGVETPAIKARLPEYGSLILEDCGDQTLERVVRRLIENRKSEELINYYEKAFEILGVFLSSPSAGTESWYQRSFNQEKLSEELIFFRENYLSNTLKYHLPPKNLRLFLEEVATLTHSLAARPRFLVHRDFHSRNLMWQKGKLVTIDFQDARPGPASYDLVSLCFDPYVPLSLDQRRSLLSAGLRFLKQNLPDHIAFEAEQTWKPMLIQRILKAIGSFGFLSSSQKRGDYLQYVPASLEILSLAQHQNWPFLSSTLPELISIQLDKQKEYYD